ncbi:MAG: HD domain-containing protein, partial [Oscillospiraceae bacterium]|nr:HD domain-containing protein [Oscillospiraceae bacterium]
MTRGEKIAVPEHVGVLLKKLTDAGYEAYVVGGCVRDSLLGIEPKDWDVCTDALPEQTMQVLAEYKLIPTGLKHGTVTVVSHGKSVEITTFRTDGQYSDNRRPDSVSFVSSLREDLARRDFTINAMAYRGGIVDLFGGTQDLKNGVIRCVGNPEKRFSEDALRIMRALRFASRYGFSVEQGTSDAVHTLRGLLKNIAYERIFTELKGILMGAGAGRMLVDFADVFAVIMPEIEPCIGFAQNNPAHYLDVWGHTARAVDLAPGDENVRLALMLHDIGKPEKFFTGVDGKGHFYGHPAVSRRLAEAILGRLRCDNKTKEQVLTLVEHHDDKFPETKKGIRRLLAAYGEDTL